jgi:hypothetical protein
MVTLTYDGRLGNNLIQYVTSLFFAKKHNFYFKIPPNYASNNWDWLIKDYQINGIIGKGTIEVNDDNFLTLLNMDNIEPKHYHFYGFFQLKEFFTKYEFEIKSLLNINHKSVNKDLVFVHYRIGDIENHRGMLPLEYYIDALENTKFNGGYISSDSLDHKNCTYLMKTYNLKAVHNLSPINTIYLGKNFNNLVLSEGTFSWWIGFLSEAENIICNKRDYLWHGDIFLDRWKKLNWDYNENTPINLKNNL